MATPPSRRDEVIAAETVAAWVWESDVRRLGLGKGEGTPRPPPGTDTLPGRVRAELHGCVHRRLCSLGVLVLKVAPAPAGECNVPAAAPAPSPGWPRERWGRRPARRSRRHPASAPRPPGKPGPRGRSPRAPPPPAPAQLL